MTESSVFDKNKNSFNAKELSELLDVHPETIRRMIRDGEIVAKKSGREYKVSAEEKNRLLNDKKPKVRDVLSHIRFVIEMYQREIQHSQKELEEWKGSNSIYELENYQRLMKTRNELQKLDESIRQLIELKRIELEDPFEHDERIEGYVQPFGV